MTVFPKGNIFNFSIPDKISILLNRFIVFVSKFNTKTDSFREVHFLSEFFIFILNQFMTIDRPTYELLVSYTPNVVTLRKKRYEKAANKIRSNKGRCYRNFTVATRELKE